MKKEYLVKLSSLPDWFTYPTQLVCLVGSGKTNLTPWHIMEDAQVLAVRMRLQNDYHRDLVPFAYRQDNDDIACFEKGYTESVLVIHIGASPGWENEGSYSSFDEWFKDVELDMRNWGATSEEPSE